MPTSTAGTAQTDRTWRHRHFPLAKVGVEGSNPFARSSIINRLRGNPPPLRKAGKHRESKTRQIDPDFTGGGVEWKALAPTDLKPSAAVL